VTEVRKFTHGVYLYTNRPSGVRRQTTREFDSRCIAQLRSAVYQNRP
jgi:hypothetical protein